MSVGTYTLILEPAINGYYDTLYGLGEGTYYPELGVVVLIRVIQDSGYVFCKWVLETDINGDGAFETRRDFSGGATLNWTANTSYTYRLTPIFVVPGTPQTLTIIGNEGGSVTPAPGVSSVIVNDVVTLTATPDYGYLFSHWEVDGYNAGAVNPTTLKISGDHTVQPVFTYITSFYAITFAPAEPGGYYDTSYGYDAGGPFNIPVGQTVNFAVEPNAEYTFVKWVLRTDYGNNGTWDAERDYSTNLQETFKSSTANIGFMLVPVFEGGPGQVILTILSSPGGTTNPPPGMYSYDLGNVAPVSSIPDPGYALSHWLVDGVVAGTTPNIGIQMAADHTVQAVFSPVPGTTKKIAYSSSPSGIPVDVNGVTLLDMSERDLPENSTATVRANRQVEM